MSSLRAAVVLALAILTAQPVSAGVVVVANRLPRPITLRVMAPQVSAVELQLPPGQSRPIFVDGSVTASFGTAQSHRLDPNTVHYVGENAAGQVSLTQIGFNSAAVVRPTAAAGASPAWAGRIATSRPLVRIPVKLCVDENEPSRQERWEPKLRQRLANASKLFEAHCGVRFEPAAFATWNSDERITEFGQSLREFEQEVSAAPGRLAIGFTSQYQLPKGRSNLGGTRGPLLSHILLREWSQRFSEPERLELLVHELGHFLCATHSPERNSVMRPVLGDRQANATQFRIAFDPVNTLILNLVAEDLRAARVAAFDDLSPATRLQLRGIYKEMVLAVPNDPAADRFVQLLLGTGATPLAEGARAVAQSVVRLAERNRQLPETAAPGAPRRRRVTGDRLMELYVQMAARTAATLPKEDAWRAFLVGLGVALDRHGVFDQPGTAHRIRSIYGTIESDAERKRRLQVLGAPTIQGREDLAQHFVISAALAVLLGEQTTESLGVLKEVSDSRPGGSGFSFADLAADWAGLAFAEGVRRGTIPVERLAHGFRLADFVPPTAGLPEGLTAEQFSRQFGSVGDDRFFDQRRRLREQIRALPGYRK
jgi:hypothetical protein